MIPTVILIVIIFFLISILLFIIIPQAAKVTLPLYRGRAPFVRTRRAILPKVVEAISLAPGSILYDLGCGDARVLRAAISSVNDARAVGIDYDWFPIILAKLKTVNLPIEIRKGDIYNTDLSGATHIYCYLLPEMVAKLEPLICSQCRPGTRIVSCDFRFPNLVPLSDVPLSNNGWQTGMRLFVYILDDNTRTTALK